MKSLRATWLPQSSHDIKYYFQFDFLTSYFTIFHITLNRKINNEIVNLWKVFNWKLNHLFLFFFSSFIPISSQFISFQLQLNSIWLRYKEKKDTVRHRSSECDCVLFASNSFSLVVVGFFSHRIFLFHTSLSLSLSLFFISDITLNCNCRI